MSAWMRENHWQMTAQKRRKPGAGAQLHVTADTSEPLPADAETPPSELLLEATDAAGEPAAWLDDFFWMSALQAWSNAPLTVRFLPTPHSLLHPVVLHHVSMLRRVAPQWRVVGHCHVNDLAEDGAINAAAQSPYHELHIAEGAREGEPRPAHPLRIEDALARIRRIQVANGRTMPIIVCVRPQHRAASPTTPTRAAEPTRERPVHAR
ncbi:MAG TPA: hypothetical protein P5572_14350 [Phycisphaerae bacterium]|nr:hypothetical protein [Phycisphaerae bacterium]